VIPVSRSRKVFDWIAGLALLLLGVAGLVLPALPGILLILAGLAILSSHSSLARRAQDALKARARQVKDRIVQRRRS
jgi:uncharacterized membrane protein YbaN (DUF454 family)